MTTLREYQLLMQSWHDRNFPVGRAGKPDRVLLKAGEELGELNRAHVNGLDGIKGSKEFWEGKAKDAVGDIILVLAVFCNEKGFDLEECLALAWAEIKDRDFQKYPQTGEPVLTETHTH